MKILVTGGCGFIGSNFIEYILQYTDMEVINLDLLTYAGASTHPSSAKYTFYKMNIASSEVYDILIKHQPDYIVNFAAETHVDRSISFPDPFMETNIFGTYKLLCSLIEYQKTKPEFKFIHISTDEVFGELTVDGTAFTENSQYKPNSPYSATKASSDHLVRAFHHTYGLPAIITNCSNNYGPRQFPEKFIPVAIMHAYNNLPIPIYGTGANIRDWLYVADHCDAIHTVLRKGKVGETYNIGGETELTNNEVVNRILLHMNKPLNLVQLVEDRKGHDFRYGINISHIKNSLGWQPKTDFASGISLTIEWYLQNMEWVKRCINLE
jgi:dTDP-glucose 4,6-dehydratase